MTDLAPLLTAFLRDHLPRERGASTHTVAAYSDAFALLLRFVAGRLAKTPSALTVENIDPDAVLAFLDHLESERGVSIATRNARLSAIRAFFRYVEFRAPICLELALRVRALPQKKAPSKLIDHLDRQEIAALLGAPDRTSPSGLRDHAILHLAYATGMRAAELLSIRPDDFTDRTLTSVRITGKGRRERVLPIWRETRRAVEDWLAVRRAMDGEPLFLNRLGIRMSRDGFAYILSKHAKTAGTIVPSLQKKNVTPHVLRHSCAMHILEATGDIRKVALWLGHASIDTTEAYLRADPTEKIVALEAHRPPGVTRGNFRARADPLMATLLECRSSSKGLSSPISAPTTQT